MNKTKIEWVKNPDGTQGYTWNPITGCLNGCEYCYARKLANGRLRQAYLGGNCVPAAYEYNSQVILDPFYPRFWEDRLNQVYKELHYNNKPRGIFVCDMSDLFGIGIPESWTKAVLWAITNRPHHRFYLLTKQPQNLIKFSPFPDNCWVGVTATSWEMASNAIFILGDKIQAKVKFISFEPLLESCIGVGSLYDYLNEGQWWFIIGAQTKPYKPPSIEWIKNIVDAANMARIPVFLKDNLKPLIDKHCPDESAIQPNHDILLRMKHPFLCKDCDETGCHKCGVIWKLRQEMLQ